MQETYPLQMDAQVSAGVGYLRMYPKENTEVMSIDIPAPSGGTLLLTEIGNVIAYKNDKPFQYYETGTELDAMNQAKGISSYATLGYLKLPISHTNLKTRDAEEMSSLPFDAASVVKTAHVDVTINSVGTPVWDSNAKPKQYGRKLSISRVGGEVRRVHRMKTDLKNAPLGSAMAEVLKDIPIGTRGGLFTQLDALWFVAKAGTPSYFELTDEKTGQKMARKVAENVGAQDAGNTVAVPAYFSFAVVLYERGYLDPIDVSSYEMNRGDVKMGVNSTVNETVDVLVEGRCPASQA